MYPYYTTVPIHTVVPDIKNQNQRKGKGSKYSTPTTPGRLEYYFLIPAFSQNVFFHVFNLFIIFPFFFTTDDLPGSIERKGTHSLHHRVRRNGERRVAHCRE